MKYSPLIYAKALNLVLKETPEAERLAVLRNFGLVVAKNGDQGQADKIAEALEGMMVREEGGHQIVIESARPLLEPETRLLKSQFGDKDRFKFKINPALVAGVRVVINGERELDNTLVRKLREIFN